MLRSFVHHLVYHRLKVFVEALHHLQPFLFAFGYLVELLLHTCGEVVVHNLWEVLHQEVVNHHTDICRQQLTLVRASHLSLCLRSLNAIFQGVYHVCAFLSILVTLLHIFALLDGRDCWSIGRRTADTQFLKLVYKTCFSISGRTLAESFCRCYLLLL